MSIRSYRDLLVWQKAMDLVVVCYQLTEKLPPSENFGLSSRIKNFASNVPSYLTLLMEREEKRTANIFPAFHWPMVH